MQIKNILSSTQVRILDDFGGLHHQVSSSQVSCVPLCLYYNTPCQLLISQNLCVKTSTISLLQSQADSSFKQRNRFLKVLGEL